MKMRVFVLSCLLIPAFGWAADGKLKLPDFKGLSEKATESVHISLGPLRSEEHTSELQSPC